MIKKNKKIMIVEDDKFLLKAYKIKLEKEKFDIILANDGQKGLEKAKKEKPSLIILDLMLPKMNGFEFLRKIKANEKLKNIPVIAVSNLGQKTDQERALELGAEEYLIKTDNTLEKIIINIRKYLK